MTSFNRFSCFLGSKKINLKINTTFIFYWSIRPSIYVSWWVLCHFSNSTDGAWHSSLWRFLFMSSYLLSLHMETRTFLSFPLCFNIFMILIANRFYKSWENMLFFQINESIVLIKRTWITLAWVEDMKSSACKWILKEGQKWQVTNEMENCYLNAKEDT